MKKIYNIVLIFMSLFFLSSCQSNLDFDFVIPEKEDYFISELVFEDLEKSAVLDFESIDEEALLSAQQANIYVSNTSYNSKWLLSKKDTYRGSGVIFFETEMYYYALTNAHIIEKHDDFNYQVIEVYDFYNNKYTAFVYEDSFDNELDLAILVFHKNERELTVLDIAYGEITISQNVIVIGNPLGEKNVISVGIVMRYGRTRIKDRYDNYKTSPFLSMVHDAKTKAGSSGGMVLNFDLKIVGISYAGNLSENITESFAIPSKVVIDYLLELTE